MEMYNNFDITNETILCEQTTWITKIMIFPVYMSKLR